MLTDSLENMGFKPFFFVLWANKFRRSSSSFEVIKNSSSSSVNNHRMCCKVVFCFVHNTPAGNDINFLWFIKVKLLF